METGAINTTGPFGPRNPAQPSAHEVDRAGPVRQRELARQPECRSEVRYVESHRHAPAFKAEYGHSNRLISVLP